MDPLRHESALLKVAALVGKKRGERYRRVKEFRRKLTPTEILRSGKAEVAAHLGRAGEELPAP